MTVTGKIRKVEIHEHSVKLLGLGDAAAAKYARSHPCGGKRPKSGWKS